jgi:hypothetical protein
MEIKNKQLLIMQKVVTLKFTLNITPCQVQDGTLRRGRISLPAPAAFDNQNNKTRLSAAFFTQWRRV